MELSCCHLFETTRITRKTKQTYKLNPTLKHDVNKSIITSQTMVEWSYTPSKKKVVHRSPKTVFHLSSQLSNFNTICAFLFIHLSMKKLVLHKQRNTFLKLLIKYIITAVEYNRNKICRTLKYFQMIKTHNLLVADIRNIHFELYLLFPCFSK